jgi:hypothetical protein
MAITFVILSEAKDLATEMAQSVAIQSFFASLRMTDREKNAN